MLNFEKVDATPGELDLRLLGSCTILEPHAPNGSASRSAMRSSFLTQNLVLDDATKRRLITGAEREYGKYTMKIKMPCDGTILKVVHKYPKAVGIFSFKRNPETTIIYENRQNGEIGSIVIPAYHCNHKVFGFDYDRSGLKSRFAVGDILPKGFVLADSPTVTPDGDYKYGIETNIAFMTVPGIIEDGIVASEAYLDRIKTKGYGSKTMEFGSEYYPLNLYGTEDEYKIFPDIGDRVRDDGILFGLRKYDPLLAVCHMTKEDLMTIDHTFDKLTYIALTSVQSHEPPIVEDITSWHNHKPDAWRTPPRMEQQVRRYNDASRIYYTQINDVYDDVLRKRKKDTRISKEYHAQLINCRKNNNNIQKAQLPKAVDCAFRRQKLDDWRVEIKYSWEIKPGIGYKCSKAYCYLLR